MGEMTEDIEDYLNRRYTYLMKNEKGRFTISVKELPGCFAEGSTVDEAWKNLQGSKRKWIEDTLESGRKMMDYLVAGTDADRDEFTAFARRRYKMAEAVEKKVEAEEEKKEELKVEVTDDSKKEADAEKAEDSKKEEKADGKDFKVKLNETVYTSKKKFDEACKELESHKGVKVVETEPGVYRTRIQG